jgi:hypothetical protein
MVEQTSLPTMPTLLELNTALHNLRRTWPLRWPGLPLVFERSWQQLNLSKPRSGSRAHALYQFGQAVVQQVEQDGAQRYAQGAEPAYHNRLHIADTLVCMTYLMRACRALGIAGADQAPVGALALVIMAGHDFLHPGGSNSTPSEFETRAVADLQPLVQAAGLNSADRDSLSHCILATDPTRVKAFHVDVRTRTFDLGQRDCLAVLVQEADILASTLPKTQEGLTQALSREWAPTQPTAAERLLLPQNRLLFLEHAALFSSPAALMLGLDKVKGRQMTSIKNRLNQTA